ncbi:MAG: flagellar biosynthesis protein FlhF [Ignavibacteriales bacterium]|nr:flagellar biosynthesis protein FlhF [Ignavibacteriales bacterium]
MRIKKFTGASLKDASEAMKQELGPEAIVLHTRSIKKGGPLNLLGKETVEITGAIDDTPVAKKDPSALRLNAANQVKQYTDTLPRLSASQTGTKGIERKNVSNQENPVEGIKDVAARFEKRQGRVELEQRKNNRMEEMAVLHQLQGEMEDVKSALRELHNQMKQVTVPSLPPVLQEAYAHLLEQDIQEHLAVNLVQTVYERIRPEHRDNRKQTERELLSNIAKLIQIPHAPLTKDINNRKPTVVALIGPTGVGKTTTIAKLSSVNKLLTHKDVALISADTYRIGAIEQLRTFAAIANIPMEVVYEPSEVQQAIEKFKSKDIVFLDTVGRSQRSTDDIADLKEFLQAAQPDEIHLVLNPSASFKALSEIVKKFKPLNPNRLLFAKLDEAPTFGSILNVLHEHRLPVSYVTNGQMVPDDILIAESSQLASMIYNGALAHA